MATNTSQIPDMSNVLGSSWFGKLKFVGILLIVLYLFKSTLIFIPPGHVGVTYDRGRGVLEGVKREGMSFAIPMWQTVYYFDTKIQEYTMSAVSDEGTQERRFTGCSDERWPAGES